MSSTAEIEGSALPVNADVGFSQVMATVLGSYRVLESDTMHVELLGGILIQDIDTSINLSVAGGSLPFTGDSTWVDPMLGAKGKMQLSENWCARGTALVGGFGISSDIVWDVSANLGYQWNNWLDLHAGFRGAGTDYKSGNFVWDITQYGRNLSILHWELLRAGGFEGETSIRQPAINPNTNRLLKNPA